MRYDRRMTPDAEQNPHWNEYYAATETRPPRDTVLRALEHTPRDGRGFDLGCGVGHDTIAMLRHGLRVTAVDQSDEAIARTRRQAQELGLDARLTTVVEPFERIELTPADLINAAYSLPFCALDAFESLWARIIDSLRPGGIFAGQLFGVNDQWATEPGHHANIFLSRAQVDELTAGLERLHFNEFEGDGTTATGKPRYWHLYHMVLRKAP